MKNLNMTQGRPAGLIFKFAVPLVFGNIFQQLYTVVDTAIVGRGVGLSALAALGAVDWLNWMIVGIAQGFTQGFSVRIAQKYGEGDIAGVKKIIAHSTLLAALIAVLLTAVGLGGLPLFLSVLRVPSDLWDMSALYMRILTGGISCVIFYNLTSAVLRAVGDSKTPLKAMIVASVTNVVLDCVAVFVLDWGIAGAAAATVLSQLLSGAICAVKILRTPELRFGREHMRKDRALDRELVKIGAPIAVKNITISLGGMTIQAIANGFGVSFIAGVTATNKLYGLLEIAAISYSYAVTTYVGQNYGAGLYDRIKRGMRSALCISIATSIVIAAVMIAFGRDITMLFISADTPALAAQAGDVAYTYLLFMSVSLPVLYILYVYLAGLQGMGNTTLPMVSGIIELFMRVSLAAAVAVSGIRIGLFAAEVSAWYGAAVFLVICYRKRIRRLNA